MTVTPTRLQHPPLPPPQLSVPSRSRCSVPAGEGRRALPGPWGGWGVRGEDAMAGGTPALALDVLKGKVQGCTAALGD